MGERNGRKDGNGRTEESTDFTDFTDLKNERRMTEERRKDGERDGRTHAIIGAAMAMYNELGRGFLEAVYQEAMAIELEKRGIPFQAQVELPVHYDGRRLNASYRADFVCCDSVVVEIKAISKTGGTEKAQVINYLKAAGYRVGLLINFGARSLEFERIVF